MHCDLQRVRIDPADPSLGRYLIVSMGSLADEVLRILFLDARGGLIADEQLQWGSLAEVALHPRQSSGAQWSIMRRALFLSTIIRAATPNRSEEHTSELQSLMRISSA